MTTAHMIALALIPLVAISGAVAAALSRRIRDILFFMMVTLAVFTERTEVNFFSEAWYRGTTRGLEVTLVELLAFGLLYGCWASRDPERRPFWPASLGLLLLYLAYACVSVAVSHPRIFGAFELSKIFASILVFLASAAYVRSKREWTLLVVALGCVVGFEGIWALKQHFITHLGRVAGTLDHANSLSMYFCVTTPLLVAVAYSGWSRMLRIFCGLCALLACTGLALTLSRAGIPIFAAVVAGTILSCATWRLTPARVIVRAILVLGLASLVAACWAQMDLRYSESSLEEEYFDPKIDGRGVYLRLSAAIVSEHFFGVGLNNWSYEVSRIYGPRMGYRFEDYDFLTSIYGTADDKQYADSYLAAPAHNLAALTLGELGIPGFLIFTLLWIRWFSMAVPFLRLPREEPMRVMGVGLLFCICGIFGQSLTEWVYRQTPILFTFYILLGALASLAHSRRQARIRGFSEASISQSSVPDECLVEEEA
jgi:O-antigen ligase